MEDCIERIPWLIKQGIERREPVEALAKTAPLDAWSNRAFVKESPIHGLGLFARRNFSTGETILIRNTRPVTSEDPLDAEKGEYEHHCDWMAGNRQVYLGFPEKYLNHSCEANAFIRFDNDVSTIVALKPIRALEEITSNYSIGLWGGEAWLCTCGATRCLGMIPGSFFELPLDRQIELAPLLPAWFTAEHAQEYVALLEAAGLEEEPV